MHPASPQPTISPGGLPALQAADSAQPAIALEETPTARRTPDSGRQRLEPDQTTQTYLTAVRVHVEVTIRDRLAAAVIGSQACPPVGFGRLRGRSLPHGGDSHVKIGVGW